MANTDRARTRGAASNPAAAKAGQEIVRVVERTGDPTAEANRVLVYAKDVAGDTELYAMASDGTVNQLTPGVGRLLREPQLVTASGAYVAPSNCRAIFVEAVGGGGGGGGATFAGADMAFGAGGAGGAYGSSYYETATEGFNFTVAIGAAGAAGTSAGGTGGTGGTTTFDSDLTATQLSVGGGVGGVGMVTGNSLAVAVGGATTPGSAGSSDLGFGGNSGCNGIRLSGTVGVSGQGGGSAFGGGGAGLATQGAGVVITAGYGAGGGGAAAVTVSAAGAAGRAGVVRVWEYS